MEQEILDDHLAENADYPNANDYDESLHGFKGWLLFLGFGLVLSVIIQLISIFKNFLPVFTENRFSLFEPTIRNIVIVEIVCNVVIICSLSYTLYCYLYKLKIFSKVFIGYVIAYTIFIWGDAILTDIFMSDYDVSGAYISGIKSSFYACIWIPYVMISKRVKHTFLF